MKFSLDLILQLETSVLVHGSDGWDTTLLVTSLAQILLDPDCRTITGYRDELDFWIQMKNLCFSFQIVSKH
jgi:hypothetical protein